MSRSELIMSIVMVLSGLGVAYTYVGYPLLLAVLSLLKRKEAKKAAWKGSVSVVLIARNAEKNVAKRIENLLAQKGEWSTYEVVAASDGSTDATVNEAGKFSDAGVKVFAYKEHRGKASVLNEVVSECSGEIIVFADARQRFDESTVAELCANFADPEIGAVSGELFIAGSGEQGAGSGLSAYWDIEKWIRKTESRTGSVIGCTGAVYALRKELFQTLHPETVLDDVAVPMNVILAGKRVVFDPAARAWDSEADTATREAARKIRTLAGNIQLCAIYPKLLCPVRNPALLRFFSHKLMRLFAPWLLVLLLASSLFLSSACPFSAVLTLLQLVFYSLALAGTALGRPRLAMLKLPSAFLLLNVWAAMAPFCYWTGKLSPRWR